MTSPRWQHLRYALILFLVSRGALFAVTFIGHFLMAREPLPPETPTPFGPASYWSAWCRGDAALSPKIATTGYSTTGPETALFPLFPGLVKVTAAITGSVWSAAFLVANLAFLFCLWGIVRLTREPFGDAFARRAAVIAAAFPTSFYLSAPVPDSTVFALFLWTSAAFMWRRPIATAVLGFALAFGHIYGVLLLPPLVIATFLRDGRNPMRWGRDALALLAMPLGLVAAHAAGAHIDVGRLVAVPWSEFLAAVGAVDWTFVKRDPIAVFALLNIGAIALLVAASVSFARRRAWADLALALVFLMAALATPRIDLALRITATVGPAIFFLARVTARPTALHFALSASALLLGLLATRFVTG
ncbi:MAG: hypothetical protein HYY84_10500 [Deltaproteobacteria bacterium]|nr:hypothetical protein [Deltaproteobacteria bacterium]